MTEEYSREAHRKAVKEFFDAPDPALQGKVHEAMYSMSELGLWPDDVSVSAEQAILCWKIVEKLRASPFPDTLRM